MTCKKAGCRFKRYAGDFATSTRKRPAGFHFDSSRGLFVKAGEAGFDEFRLGAAAVPSSRELRQPKAETRESLFPDLKGEHRDNG
jgi:hypothetical protein